MKRKDGLFQRQPGGPWYAAAKWKGQRVCECTGFTQRTRAKGVLDRMKVELRAGTYRTPTERRAEAKRVKVETIGALAQKWQDVYVKVNRDEKGQRLAKSRVDRYLIHYFGDVPAKQLTKDSLREYRAYLEGLRDDESKEPLLTVQTVRHILSDARCLLLWAADGNWIENAPVPRKLLPTKPETPLRSLSHDDQEKVAAVDDPYGFAVRVMLATGARFSELCRLQASDLQNGELLIHGETKSGKMRSVPVPATLAAEIKGRIGRLVPFEAKDDSWFNRAVRDRSDVESFSAHACRHSFGFNYIRDGGNILVLKELMGHSTVELTARYARPSQALVREDAKKVAGRRSL